MSAILQIPTQDTVRRIQRIQAVTIIWMSVEAAVSLSAAWIARSPALLAFGGDSTIDSSQQLLNPALDKRSAQTTPSRAKRSG